MNKLLLAVMNILGFIIPAEAQIPTEKTLLWEVSGKGITQPSYLFGTIHLMCPDELRMPTVVKDKFISTKQLFLEIDIDDPQMMPTMMKSMKMSNDTTLHVLLGEDYEKVNLQFTKTTGISLSLMNHTKPMMLMSMVYPSILGCVPVSWESEFQKMAKQQNMDINGLETIADQINVFDKIPYKVQAEMFSKMLTDIDSSKKQFQEMLDLYNKKDIHQMNMLTSQDEDFGAYENILLTERNNNWIPVIGEQAKKSPTFFAFGAGHLGGEKGVINLLRKSGFTVTPIVYE